MKKLTLLAGAIGSTAAWYILSNKKIRNDLAKAKTPEQTIKILTKYLGRDASKIGNAVHDFTHSEEFLENVDWAKELAEEKYGVAKGLAEEKFKEAKKGLGGLWSKAMKAKDEVEKNVKKRLS